MAPILFLHRCIELSEHIVLDSGPASEQKPNIMLHAAAHLPSKGIVELQLDTHYFM